MEVAGLERVPGQHRFLKMTRGTVEIFVTKKKKKPVNDSSYRLQFLGGKSHAPRAGRTWLRRRLPACILQPVPGMGRHSLLCFQPLNEQGFHGAACVLTPCPALCQACVIGPEPGEEARTSRIHSLSLWRSRHTGPGCPEAPPTLSRDAKGSLWATKSNVQCHLRLVKPQFPFCKVSVYGYMG